MREKAVTQRKLPQDYDRRFTALKRASRQRLRTQNPCLFDEQLRKTYCRNRTKNLVLLKLSFLKNVTYYLLRVRKIVTKDQTNLDN